MCGNSDSDILVWLIRAFRLCFVSFFNSGRLALRLEFWYFRFFENCYESYVLTFPRNSASSQQLGEIVFKTEVIKTVRC